MAPTARALRPLIFSLFAFASCVVVDGWQSSPLLAVWAAGSGVRWYCGDEHVALDAVVFGLWNAFLGRDGLKSSVTRGFGNLDVDFNVGLLLLLSRLAVPLILVGLLVRWQVSGEKNASQDVPDGFTEWTLPYPKPRIFPCQTKHARMFPKRHSFEYSYLQCGFPIIPGGVAPDGKGVGLGKDRLLGRWWLRVRAEDYLERGNGALGFYGKLKAYLKAQNVEDSEWSYAYLITAPRFFGYAFNPVSFWYVYDRDHQLVKMILEVNNTFGERRMYLLDGSNVPSMPLATASEVTGPDLPSGAKSRFTDIWMKDFHVSPFNSRKGSYVLKALNPFPYVTYDDPMIDNTITLISSKDFAKLVARLNSTGPAIDPDRFGVIDVSRFILSWWWVGLVTFPRIAKEAFKLFFKRGLHVWFRPEVHHTSLGRLPTSTEIDLYKGFKDYLYFLVNQAQEPFNITLHNAISDDPHRIITTTRRPGQDEQPRELEIRVLTPAFYSRFVHYAYTSEAFDRESIFTDEKNRTLWISRPQLLPLLINQPSPPESDDRLATTRSYLSELRWRLLRKLRCAPAAPSYECSTPGKVETKTEDVRSLPYSEFDQYVRSSPDRAWAAKYRRTVTKLYLAQRLSLGFPEVIGLLDLLFRILLCFIGALQIAAWRTLSHNASFCRDSKSIGTNGTLGVPFQDVSAARGEWWWLISGTLSVSACHIYGMLKGYD